MSPVLSAPRCGAYLLVSCLTLFAQQADSTKAAADRPVVAADGSLEVTGDSLRSSLVVTRAADGTLTFECKQGGDHRTHAHSALSGSQEALR